ncbi:DUF1761 domain-containing protein [Sphingomonas sp. BK580]|uniref:DUF1761 domain-containing protein n=1 Tax=Sphingomonas sp. BK580 TaxID=2586972 RepID=UPI001619D34F|nr:DUF1761 domain-containing protein [Sphingomonas sp. BK580]MBB3695226.1 hypothetical protein [Sphingomonas sp. BK580]
MTSMISQVNWLAVLVAAIAHFVLGGVWFGAVFAKAYARSLGIDDRPAVKPSAIFLAGPLVCGLVIVGTTAILMRMLALDTLGGALALGGLVGVGYLGAMTVNIAINPLFPRPFLYAAVNAPMFILGSLMSAAILTALG